MVNAMNGRDPRAGVVEQVIGDRYIIDPYPPATRTSYGSGRRPLEPEAPKTPARALWPHLK
jgi:hypothetical protein